MPGELQPVSPTSPLTTLIAAWLEGDVTTLEMGRRLDRQQRAFDYPASLARDTLTRLFPPYPGDEPDPAIVRLLTSALLIEEPAGDALAAIAGRRALLAAVIELDPSDTVVEIILRPGERILLGTTGGRKALAAILADDTTPFVDWLSRTVLDTDAFASTTSDVPLHGLDNLQRLITGLACATASLAAGPARVMVADEWVAETTVAALTDDVPFAEVARTIGETLLKHEAPILLWHAAHELALVAEDDPDLRDIVLRKCLTHADCEAGRCPAEAAAPLLSELGTQAAVRLLESIGTQLDANAWRAIGKTYLRNALAEHWHDWREHAQRWATADDANRARATFDALLRTPAPEPGAIAWFTDSSVPSVRAACRQRLGLAS